MKDDPYLKAFIAGREALGLDHNIFWRLHVVLFFAHRCINLEGDFVECGVWNGFLSRAIMSYLKWENVNKKFYLFDTFEGLVDDFLTSKEKENTEKITHLNSYYEGTSFEKVSQTFSNFKNVHLVKGIVPDTLSTVKIEKVAYLSLDMNCAIPEIEAAEYFWDKMASSAVIILDDYGFVSYEEQKKLFDAFAKRKKTEILHLPTGQGIILKP